MTEPAPKRSFLRTWRGRLLALAFGLLIALVIAEVSMRVMLGSFELSEIVQPSDDRALCIELKPGSNAMYDGRFEKIPATSMSVNEHGARGPSFPAAKPAGTLRVAAVGDSFTFGQGVEFEHAFLTVAEQALVAEGRAVQMLNFAVPGHGTPQAVAQVRHRAVQFDPDVVVLSVFPNDLTPREMTCQILALRPDDAEPGSHPPGGIYVIGQILRLMPQRSHPDDRTKAPPPPPPSTLFVAAVTEFIELGKTHGFQPVVVLLTDRRAYENERDCAPCPAPHDLLVGLDVPVIDMGPHWEGMGSDWARHFIPGDGHLSVDGNQVMGAQLAVELRRYLEP
ncbi:MAG: SGNH/GDSL hydrolase family protein [Proteobacteria bacterium]|nr:SGNH/GDSL hydrolase family protein [Pseudomonadota bacterium]